MVATPLLSNMAPGEGLLPNLDSGKAQFYAKRVKLGCRQICLTEVPFKEDPASALQLSHLCDSIAIYVFVGKMI